MNKLRRSLLGLIGLLFVMQLAFVSPVAAQTTRRMERERISRVMKPDTNVAEFRQELINYFTEMDDAMRLYSEIPAVRQRFSRAGLQPLAIIAEAKQKIATMTPEELAQLRAVYAGFPGWREAPRSINSLIKPALREQLEVRVAAKQNGGGGATINGVPDNCQDGINADVTNTDISIAKAVLIAAQAVADSVPPVVNIPATVAVAAADSAVLALETLKGIKDDCTGLDSDDVQGIVDGAKTEIINNDNSNKDSIVNNDNTNTTSIITNLNTKTTTVTTAITNAKTEIVNNDNSNKTAIINNDNSNTSTLNTAVTNATTNINNNNNANSTALATAITNATNSIVSNDNANRTTIVNNDNSNTTNIVNNDNANRTTIVNNDNANTNALRDLLLRTQIEADLAENTASTVALYMLPTGKGGYLDLVQTIVTESLNNIVAAGGKIGNARTFLNLANADKSAGRFKSAYLNYRRAYRTAVDDASAGQ